MRHLSQSSPLSKQTGFTLIEVLIALSIFAVISVMSYQALNTLIFTEQQSRNALTTLTEVQRAIMMWERDLRQVAPRAITNDFNATEPSMRTGEGFLLELTTNNYYDWSGKRGHTLQRIRYRFNEGKLLREVWVYPDYTRNTEPQTLILLDNLINSSIEVIEANANQSETNAENTGILANSNAVSLIIEHRQLGIITRTIVPYPL
ncbi:MAG: type II secretion system minor pseudopilin GspJ [Thiofilum sp.]|uniref:type II secretion system minor pseudopilin GspJ n=1 Tax=Thiofilum sp. TaxID=2212733 RepID=UPI0025D3E0DE|nr:type II secretion system minor pseudopilin GspJ [Thiofilum sp.]MBK8452517.1 type II secretion system minor pseudopilin GspJ [Thiofilum sp.]